MCISLYIYIYIYIFSYGDGWVAERRPAAMVGIALDALPHSQVVA